MNKAMNIQNRKQDRWKQNAGTERLTESAIDCGERELYGGDRNGSGRIRVRRRLSRGLPLCFVFSFLLVLEPREKRW
jgi:hypothetical protein